MTCQHEEFHATVNVTRLARESGAPIVGYTADVAIKCSKCGMPFRFVGVSAGNHYAEPRVSIDGTELRAPIEPALHEKFAPAASYVTPPRARH